MISELFYRDMIALGKDEVHECFDSVLTMYTVIYHKIITLLIMDVLKLKITE